MSEEGADGSTFAWCSGSKTERGGGCPPQPAWLLESGGRFIGPRRRLQKRKWKGSRRKMEFGVTKMIGTCGLAGTTKGADKSQVRNKLALWAQQVFLNTTNDFFYRNVWNFPLEVLKGKKHSTTTTTLERKLKLFMIYFLDKLSLLKDFVHLRLIIIWLVRSVPRCSKTKVRPVFRGKKTGFLTNFHQHERKSFVMSNFAPKKVD